jgi:hypothetical protein
MDKEYVWRNRQNIVRACIRRHAPGDFLRLIQLARKLDAATRGRLRVDPWQLATELVFGLASGGAKAA